MGTIGKAKDKLQAIRRVLGPPPDGVDTASTEGHKSKPARARPTAAQRARGTRPSAAEPSASRQRSD